LFRSNPFALSKASIPERILRRVRFNDCYRHQDIIPPLNPAQSGWLEDLERDGTAIIENHISKDVLGVLQSEIEIALQELDFEMPCLAQSKVDPHRHKALIDNYLLGTNLQLQRAGVAFDRSEARSLDQVVRDFSPSTLTSYILARSPTYRSVWLDPQILAVVARYLGLVPKLVEAYVRRNYPAKYRVMNHYWHRDLNDPHQLVKVFYFLTDTTLDNGPHEFIRGSHRDYAKLNGRRYYPDEEVDREHPAGSAKRLTSEVKAGTVIIEDTRGLHRAKNPDVGFRDLGYAVFIPQSDDTQLKYYEMPRVYYETLSSFQKLFIPPAVLS
jgi:hypothetical protein